MWLRGRLPEHHLREDSKDMVRLVTGLIATLSALVLGLLIASSKSSFDAVNEGFKDSAAKIILVDRALARYGPEAREVREALRNAYAARLRQLFPDDRRPGTVDDNLLGPSSLETLDQKLLALAPTSELQRLQKDRALQLSNEIAQARWMAFEEVGTRTPPVFLTVLVAWLTAMFASFGLFAPQNRTTMTALVIGALSVATAIFLIEEMSNPLGGIIAISETPMRNALGMLGK
jgi:hypothetical protein